MKITNVQDSAIPDVKVISFARFKDDRGYFTEFFNDEQLVQTGVPALQDQSIGQANESVSHAGVVRGLHLQHSPYMGKLVRTISGRMIDLFLDIREGSPTFGQLAAYDMPAPNQEADEDQIIWVPPGFAHGNIFTEETRIGYLCTGTYNGTCETGVSPLAGDINRDLIKGGLREIIDEALQSSPTLSQKDRDAMTVAQFADSEFQEHFVYEKLKKDRLC